MSGGKAFYRTRLLIQVALVFVLQVLLLDHVAAQDTVPLQRELEDQGYTVISFQQEGPRVVGELRHHQNFSVSISSTTGLGPEEIGRFLQLHEFLAALPGLQIGRVRLSVEGRRITAGVVPREYLLQGVDYRPYLPGGMRFVFEDSWSYDFRLMVENFSLRIHGQFLTPRQLSERVVGAVENPAGYIRSSDPYYLAQRLEQQQRDMEALEEALRVALREQTRLMKDQRLAQESALAERAEDLSRVFRENFEQVSEELDMVRRGVVFLEGRSFFGSLREISPRALSATLELLQEEPSLDPDQVRDRVNQKLPEGDPPLHRRHVEAVLAVYRGELPGR
ncbi:hypothetical protein SAMN05920897_11132 [Alkalispirochaeta americana]|uniref:Uncharacterized protein n=1 Tax=Alkalispirochaeta americana TaxID=159291 RepID=A0A1N6TXR2_9SPIO|nr:hypothetical protein [Alkalispirochaeta americana]SIQ58077.1 hypothetical protein SAMN05920897_11132 [Alkalispirochaeta americana]